MSYTRRGTAVPIGVNLSSNTYPTGVLPHPSIPSPKYRGGEILRQQSRGGVTRILTASE
ncbi:MAG: hypothetical protein V7K38_06465 [Nostoc sp.]|uniref:hypothetical protein n=1 Tax=Nostoc sp. TaxID=1180 RepID=UPI002FF5B825